MTRSVAIWILLGVAGCASSAMTRIGPVAAPKPDSCTFEVFMSEQDVKRPHEVLCLLEGTSGRTLFHNRTVQGALEELHPEICRCGADAIIITNAHTTGADAERYGEGTVVAKGIRYTDGAMTAAKQ